MLNCMYIQLCSLVYLILLIGVVLSKKKSYGLEGSIYKVLLFLTLFVLCFDTLAGIAISQYQSHALLAEILSKCYLAMTIIWCFGLMIYVFCLNINTEIKTIKDLIKNNKKIIVGLIITTILCIIVFFLNVPFKDDATYITGQAVYYSFIVSMVYIAIMTIYVINNPKAISLKKQIPIFIFLLLYVATMVVQWNYASLTLISSVMAFIMLFIYFTTENPDLKIINELEKDKVVIEEASSAKTDFLSNMSHDIRTPMNAIIGFSESLLQEQLTEYQKEEVQSIYEAASTLLAIINNILDISRIESGKEEKKEKEYELRKMLSGLTTIITTKVDPAKIKFNVSIDKNVPAVLFGDELKLYQILMNLLSNAVKYTEAGEVNFTVTSENLGDEARLKFVVSDTGIGIKEDDYKKMFVKFSRIHNQENHREIEGTGLGLVITKSLVELLGGTIEFVSEFQKGTTFTVIIPQKIIHAAELAPMLNKPSAESDGIISAGNFQFDGSLYDILIVDDNNLNIKVAERILSDYKFHIYTAQSGEECLKLLKEGKRFDLIFLDHMMPIMDGIETLQHIKTLEGIKIPPVIALTANAMVGMKEMYLSEGFDGYISKPINRDELQKLLNNIFCHR